MATQRIHPITLRCAGAYVWFTDPDDLLAAGSLAAVFGRMIEHYSSILANGLVPRHARRRFFAAMAADFRRYRPPGYRRPPGLRGLRTALISHDAYRAYALLVPVNNARMTARRAIPGGR